MEHQDFLNLVEAAKRDKKKIKAFKVLAVDCQQFSLASDLRDIERELFPESREMTDAKIEASKLNLVFRMVGLDVPDRVAWLVNQTLKKHWKRRGNFDLKDAATLRAKTEELFGEP
jgi:hypothetical protein